MLASMLKSLAKDSIVYGLSGMMVKLVGFILFPLFARHFTPEIYGVISVLNSMNLVLLSIASMGMEAAALRWFYDKDDPKYRSTVFASWFFGQVIFSLLLSSIVYIFFRRWLEINYLKINQSDTLLLIVLTNLLLNVIPSIFNLYFMINKKPLYSLLVSFGLVLLIAVSSLLLVFVFNMSVHGFYLGQSIGLFVISVIGAVYFIKTNKYLSFDFQIWKQMIKYGAKVVPATISNQFLLLLAILIIQSLTSQADLGYFQVGYTLATGILFFTGGFGQAFSPYALSLNEREMIRFNSWVFDIYVSGMCFICFSVSLFYKEIITILLSAKYVNSEVIAGVFTFSNFILSLNTIASIALVKRKNIGIYGRVILICNVLSLILVYFFTNKYGIQGAPIGFLISQTLGVVLIFYYSQKTLYVPYALGKNFVLILIFLTLYFTWLFYNKNDQSSLYLKIIIEIIVILFILLFNRTHFSKLKVLLLQKHIK